MAKEDDKKFPEKAEVGKYPYNLVTVWPDGRELHLNYTPNNYTTRYFTNVGTGFEIDKDGRFVIATMSNQHNYSKGGSSTTVEKNIDNKTGGGTRESNDGGSHTENGQNASQVTNGTNVNISKENNLTASSASKTEEIVPGDKISKANNIHLLVMGDNVMYIKGSNIISINGESSEQVKGNKTSEISSNYKVIVGSKLVIEVPTIEFNFTDMTINGSNIEMNAQNMQMNIDSVIIDGSTLKHKDKNIGFDHKHKGVMAGGSNTQEPV